LNLTLVEIEAGRSSQATLLGREEMTVESLYLSPVLADELEAQPAMRNRLKNRGSRREEALIHA